MSRRRPFTPKAGSEKKAVESNRDLHIPLHGAVGEIIDNSIEWGAKNIHLLIKWKERARSNSPFKPDSMIFIDDGVGMSKEKIPDSLVVGYHEDSEIDNKIGKYGVGSVYAFLSLCRKSEIYSKKKNENWYYSSFDLDSKLLDDTESDYPLDAIEKNPPEFLKKYWEKLESGTIVIWSKMDRGEIDREETLKIWLGRAYRKFIGEKVVFTDPNNYKSNIIENPNPINLYYNDKKIKAYDPLYVIPFRDEDKIGGRLYEPLIIKMEKPDSSGIGEIIINIGVSPENWRLYKNTSATDPINQNERFILGGGSNSNEIIDSRKISILRNNREVSWLHDSNLFGRYDPLDRWWGMEISYNSDMDEIFNVENVKHRLKLSTDLRNKIKEELYTTIEGIRKEISRVMDLNENTEKEKRREEEKENNFEVSFSEDELEEVKDTEVSIKEHLEKELIKKKDINKELNELNNRKFVVKEDFKKRIPLDTNAMFEYQAELGEIYMTKYMNHPWFSKFEELEEQLNNYIQNSDKIDSKKLNEYFHEQRLLWEILFRTLVVSLATIPSNSREEKKFVQTFLSKWGSLSSKKVEEREEYYEEE